MMTRIELDGIPVDVQRKDIRSLRLKVCPLAGSVRITAPFFAGLELIRGFVNSKLDWIRRQQEMVRSRAALTPCAYADGDFLMIRGERHVLRVIEFQGRPSVSLVGGQLVLKVDPATGQAARKALVDRWLREELKRMVPPLLEKWQAAMGVRVAAWNIKKMKTRWGTCNPYARRIWLNLELVRHPPHCLELIVVHELAHLLERSHNARFKAIMDQHLPLWRQYRGDLMGIRRGPGERDRADLSLAGGAN